MGIDPRLVFRIELQAGVSLDDQSLAGMGLHILSADGLGRIAVFPDDETLHRLLSQIELYRATGGTRYQNLAGIELIRPLEANDRIGRKLRQEPLGDEEEAALDVELWHSGNQWAMHSLVDQLSDAFPNDPITDRYVGRSVCLLRMRLSCGSLATLLQIDHVKEIDRRAKPSFELLAVTKTELGELNIGPPPDADAPGIVVVDSGIVSGHPLLEHVVAERASMVPEDPVRMSSGHGTWVAGIAAYGDVGTALSRAAFEPSVWLFSARVTTTGDDYDSDRLLESQMQELVRHYTGDLHGAKVFNVSLGDLEAPYSDGALQFRLASVIDELAYEFRDNEILFVISSGNRRRDVDLEELKTGYPDCLLDDEARVIDPATACLAVTVGGLSYGEAAGAQMTLDLADRNIAERGWPSPFTRTGLGLGGALKPEFVEWAGDVRFSGVVQNQAQAGLPTTSHLYSPPDSELLRVVAGTSFAAPNVAHQAARLFDTFPDASSNLVRALLADSAELPIERPPSLMGLQESDEHILRIYGYGQPSLDRARASEQSDVLLVADSVMDLDWVQLYSIPPLPAQFQTTHGRGHLSVTLAYDPPTRHTRTKDYLGVRMQFALYRNVDPDGVFAAIRSWSEDEREALEGEDVPRLGDLGNVAVRLAPGPQLRNRGTLQRGRVDISGQRWTYDGNQLVLAVICQRRWAPPDISSQRFAVVVSVSHDSPAVDLYAAMRARASAYQRIRIRA